MILQGKKIIAYLLKMRTEGCEKDAN